ncbi:hypothetical protein ACFWM7_35100 [Streptomyces sp. NPDC058375]|uniref:hypothetical protein n=1 Tax=Streptomyces sp. NPDC058375 TaxID=3346467 RepID=UPI00365788DD
MTIDAYRGRDSETRFQRLLDDLLPLYMGAWRLPEGEGRARHAGVAAVAPWLPADAGRTWRGAVVPRWRGSWVAIPTAWRCLAG